MADASLEDSRKGIGSLTAQSPVTKRKSGSETRRRTENLSLRLLPSEQAAMRAAADQASYPSVQAWLLEVIRPHLENANGLEAVTASN